MYICHMDVCKCMCMCVSVYYVDIYIYVCKRMCMCVYVHNHVCIMSANCITYVIAIHVYLLNIDRDFYSVKHHKICLLIMSQ